MDEDKAAPEGAHKQDNDDEEMLEVVGENPEVRYKGISFEVKLKFMIYSKIKLNQQKRRCRLSK